MFYVGWIALTATGILASIAVFIWAVRAGQFSDQGRARYLPLTDECLLSSDKAQSSFTMEAVALIMIMAIGLIAMVGAVIMTLLHAFG